MTDFTDVNLEGMSKFSGEARKRGRPPGSKNKGPSKVAMTKAAAIDLRTKLGPYLGRDDLNYMIEVLDGKVSPELAKDLDIFLTLQLKALLPQLAGEIQSGSLTREATQRSSTVKELLALRFQMEKQGKGEEKNDQYTFIQNVFDSRGLDTSRLIGLLGSQNQPADQPPRVVSPSLSGDDDGDEGTADEAGALPDQLPE